MRQERFPRKRSSKLAPRGDGPFKVLERINDNAYRIELPDEFNISSTFNISDLTRFDADEPVLRSKPFQEGGNDEDIQPEPNQVEEDRVPFVPNLPMTRSRTRNTHYGFNQYVGNVLEQIDKVEMARRTLTFHQAQTIEDQLIMEKDQLIMEKDQEYLTAASMDDLMTQDTKIMCAYPSITTEELLEDSTSYWPFLHQIRKVSISMLKDN